MRFAVKLTGFLGEMEDMTSVSAMIWKDRAQYLPAVLMKNFVCWFYVAALAQMMETLP